MTVITDGDAAIIKRRDRQHPRPPIDVNSGRGFAFVDHVGMVYPSGFLPIAVGSVRDLSFPEIYRDSELLQQLRDPDALGGRCRQHAQRLEELRQRPQRLHPTGTPHTGMS